MGILICTIIISAIPFQQKLVYFTWENFIYVSILLSEVNCGKYLRQPKCDKWRGLYWQDNYMDKNCKIITSVIV